MQQNEQKDPQLWEIAQKRAGFKSSLLVYFLVNVFLWILWAVQGAKTNGSGIPWPLWSTLGWGIGMDFIISMLIKTWEKA